MKLFMGMFICLFFASGCSIVSSDERAQQMKTQQRDKEIQRLLALESNVVKIVNALEKKVGETEGEGIDEPSEDNKEKTIRSSGESMRCPNAKLTTLGHCF
ncbi:hypothetical protein [Psychrobium sp. 1_MG-2023]|uniref:hypothetical protein n=1 Tax=Psychrobium sp. 1_MG-2023 TaxID=3062624 RepID=UPI000C31C2A3|nr:hypothetical protein [Psychrobium sp. 1_MG-2023]MDP2559900.1 hypothetical protein [Psychrobium sp. 1_MG-2023]PKF58999.1 hypothetical protein CW748_02080 [Alteromonadales bacterium alter-6D02]